MKKIIILKHGGGELANQLWNYISIYAYGLETGAEVQNPSFFEYHPYFKFIEHENFLTRFFSYWFRDSIGRRGSSRNRFWRNAYLAYAHSVQFFVRNSVVSSENEGNQVVYLPTTLPTKDTLYFVGWLFRNPAGLKRCRRELVSAFTPNSAIEKKVTDIIGSLRQTHEKIIGVHIRQHDYREFKGGAYFIDQTRVKEIIDEFIQRNSINKNATLFLITSDGPIEGSIFRNLNTYISKEDSVTDLFLLSSTDMIIGSDSSFGAFASWYGNIPHIVMTKNQMDWNYYADKKEFFENKYAKMVQC